MALWRLALALILVPSMGHRAELDQAHLARQLDHLHEQLRELLQVQRTEVADSAVPGEVARAQHPKRQILVQPALDLARAEHACGVPVNQHLDHHRRVKRLVACAATGVAGVEGLQIERVDRVADEVRRCPLGSQSCSDAGSSISCCGS